MTIAEITLLRMLVMRRFLGHMVVRHPAVMMRVLWQRRSLRLRDRRLLKRCRSFH